MRQIVKVHITSSVHFPPRPPFNVDVTKNGYIANETSSAINATLKRVGGGRDEYSRGKVVQCLYNVFETTLSHSILSKIVYITLSELHFYKTEVNFTITESSARSLGVWRDVINAYNRFVICTSLLYCTASLLYLERFFSRLCNLHKFALF